MDIVACLNPHIGMALVQDEKYNGIAAPQQKVNT